MTAWKHPASVLARLQQQARRRFGQHFLVRPELARAIVARAGVGPGDRVLEIGPGLGALTEALLETGAQLRVIELDRDLAAHLRRTHPDLDLVEADATRVDWSRIAPGRGWVVCANLPYNIGTGLTADLVTMHPRFARLVVMLQREVAERMLAGPGDPARGALSVHVQAHTDAELAFDVPPTAFHPPPKVDSAVVDLCLRPAPEVADLPPDHFRRVVRAGFSRRRKTVENALSGTWCLEVARKAVAETVGAGRRAQDLDLAEWAALARALPLEPKLGRFGRPG